MMPSHKYSLDDYARYLNSKRGVTMYWDEDLSTDTISVVLSKQNTQGREFLIKKTFTRYVMEKQLHVGVVRDMAEEINEKVERSEMTNQWNIGGGGGGAGAVNAIDSVYDTVYVQPIGGIVNIPVQGGGGGGGPGSTTLPYVVSKPGEYSPAGVSTPAADRLSQYVEQKKHFNDEDMMAISKFKEDSKAIIKSIYSSLPLSGYANPIMDDITPALVIAGGVYTSLYHKEFIKDCDVFFLDFPLTQKKVMEAIDHEMASSPSRFVESDLNYLANAGNKLIKRVVLDNNTRIQYIFTTYANRQELLDHFDAEHACISYHNDKLYVSPLTFDCIKNKTLKSHKGNTIALWRVDKFKKRGFKFASIRI